MSLVEVTKSPLFRAARPRRARRPRWATWFSRARHQGDGRRAAATSPLSGGNQQKVLVARALLAEADIIVLDDPTKGVDVGTKRQMYALFREAAEAGKLVIWYSTEDEELESCSRDAGASATAASSGSSPAPTATKQRIVEASFAGEDLLVRREGGGTAKAGADLDAGSARGHAGRVPAERLPPARGLHLLRGGPAAGGLHPPHLLGAGADVRHRALPDRPRGGSLHGARQRPLRHRPPRPPAAGLAALAWW